MKSKLIGLIFLYVLACTDSCTPPEDTSDASMYAYGVLSSVVESYSTEELTLKVRFYIIDAAESNQLTTKNIENNMTLSSYDVEGFITGYSEDITEGKGNYSCAVLLDEIFNIYSYDFETNYSITDTFLRKFFKNAGNNNSFRLSSFNTEVPGIRFYGNGYTSNAQEMDLTIAGLTHGVVEPKKTFSKSSILQNIDIMLDTINKSSVYGNRNLLLLSSDNDFIKTEISLDSVINKARRYGIAISTIFNDGWSEFIEYSPDIENIHLMIADNTGGFVYYKDYSSYDNNILILASQLSSILEGNFRCFESTWKILPADSNADPFQPGFSAEGTLEIDLGTQYLSNVIELPIIINIK